METPILFTHEYDNINVCLFVFNFAKINVLAAGPGEKVKPNFSAVLRV